MKMNLRSDTKENIDELIDQMIVETGYGTIADLSNSSMPTFSTIGYTEKGYPELVFSVEESPEVCSVIYRHLADNWDIICRSEQKIFHADDLGLPFPWFKRVKLVEIDPQSLGPTLQHLNIRYLPTTVRVINVIFSDSAGHFPDSPEFKNTFRQKLYPIKYLH
jgi:hypothetical protein